MNIEILKAELAKCESTEEIVSVLKSELNINHTRLDNSLGLIIGRAYTLGRESLPKA